MRAVDCAQINRGRVKEVLSARANPQSRLAVSPRLQGAEAMRILVLPTYLLVLSAASMTFAQGGNGQLGGIVSDPSGALLPGVSITATNPDTGITSTTISNETGSYNFPSLQPGSAYRVSASLPGFQTRTVNNFELRGG